MLMNREGTSRARRGASVVALIFCLVLCVSLWILPTQAAADARVYDDTADLLSDAEQTALETQMAELSAKYDVELYMATYRARNYADDFVGDDYCRVVRNLNSTNAILLIVTYDESDRGYYYDIYTYGRANRAVSDKEVNYILDADAVYDNLKSGSLFAGAGAFFNLAGKAYDGRVGVSFAIIIPVCAVLAGLISLLVVKGVKDSYAKKHASVDYPLDRFARLELTAESDTFAGTFVTHTRSPRGGSSGGGGRSTHGGGGGHRGGR